MSVYIVDQIMGQGKTSAAINYINSLPEDSRIMFVTPYNNKEKDRDGNYKNANEVQRIISACPSKHFVEPDSRPTKIASIKRLLKAGRNIATTHVLFSMFDDEIIELCYSQNYILFMDEVADVVHTFGDLTKCDLNNLFNDGLVSIEESTKILVWNDNIEYDGRFEDIRTLCKNRCLAIYGDDLSIWLFPIRIFEAFYESYILTYLFEAQMQKYYYDFNGLKYEYLYVTGNSVENYRFTDVPQKNHIKCNYKERIHIIDNDKMNRIGDMDHSLSKSWYDKHGKGNTNNKTDALMERLKLNTYNFFKNEVPNGVSSNNLWTCFKDFQGDLKGGGYSKAFLSHNIRATNKYAECHNVAYLINKYVKPMIKNFFIVNDISVDEDGYALSEMIQFIWRSAIRNCEEIWLYIPSARMRKLLIDWLDEREKEYFGGM